VEGQGFAEQFTKLENRIKEVVETYRDFAQTKSALESRIYELEEALKTKAAAEQRYVEEKSIIGAKIEGLLSRLDEAADQR
jgi:hypothetical protein